MGFLRTKTGFFVCVLLPVAVLFLIELYRLIIVIINIKRPAVEEIDEEEIKRRAIEEYLAEQQKKNNGVKETEKTADTEDKIKG